MFAGCGIRLDSLGHCECLMKWTEMQGALSDFIIVRRDPILKYIVDILEPHNPDFKDNLGKAKGLANYAANEPRIGRVQLIRIGKDAAGENRFKRLDLAKGSIRNKVLAAINTDELDHILTQTVCLKTKLITRIGFIMERINATTGSYNFIDLFAGAGGLSEGFIQAGFSPVAHVEMNPYAAQTLETRTGYYYLKAQGKLDIYKDYISRKITRDEFLQHIPEEQLQSVFCETMSNKTLPRLFENIDRILTQRGIKQVDVIIGGPPCRHILWWEERKASIWKRRCQRILEMISISCMRDSFRNISQRCSF